MLRIVLAHDAHFGIQDKPSSLQSAKKLATNNPIMFVADSIPSFSAIAIGFLPRQVPVYFLNPIFLSLSFLVQHHSSVSSASFLRLSRTNQNISCLLATSPFPLMTSVLPLQILAYPIQTLAYPSESCIMLSIEPHLSPTAQALLLQYFHFDLHFPDSANFT